MVRKIALGTLLMGLIGVLVAGAIISTVDKTENVAEARGAEQGRGAGGQRGYEVQQTGWDPSSDTQRKGRGGNSHGDGVLEDDHTDCDSHGGGEAERQYPNNESTPEEWVVYEGTVTQAPAAGVDLVVTTGDGQQVLVGAGPGYMETPGFTLQVGEQVRVEGYWEDDELKAGQVTRLQDDQTITLRDQDGHPEWAGSGKRANEQRASLARDAQGQRQEGRGQGQGGRGQGQGGRGQDGHSDVEFDIPASGGDLSEDEAVALRAALSDEYKAWSVYDQVIADFGTVRPFTSIQKAEENHIAALMRLFDAYGLDAPANEWPGNVPTYDTLAEACQGGVDAEIANAALYYDELLGMVDNPDIVRVFESLQRASEYQHLPAFQRCAP